MSIYQGVKKREKIIRAHPHSMVNLMARGIIATLSVFYGTQWFGKSMASDGVFVRGLLAFSNDAVWGILTVSKVFLFGFITCLIFAILAKSKLAIKRSWSFLWLWMVIDGIAASILFNPGAIIVDANSLWLVEGGQRSIYMAVAVICVVMICGFLSYKELLHKKLEITVDGVKGTAEWGNPNDLVSKKGLLVGKVTKKWLLGARSVLLRHHGEDHMVTIAKTGFGKGVGVVIPALLDWKNSVVVSDLKGENFAVTANHRAKNHKNTIWVADPDLMVAGYPVDEKGRTRQTNIKRLVYNPLSVLEDDINYGARVTWIVSTIIETNPLKAEPYFDNDAMEKLKAAISVVWTLMDKERTNLYEVAKFLAYKHEDVVRLTEYAILTSTNPEAIQMMRALTDIEFKQYAQAKSTIMSNIGYVSEAVMWNCMTGQGETTFDPSTLKKELQSVYLVINDQKAKQYRGWVRLMVSSILDGVRRSDNVADQRVLLMLDEFANMGKMDEIIEGFSKDRGRHIRYWVIVQNLIQLEVLYKGFQRFMSDAGITQIFGINDDRTAKMLSEGLGTTTVQDQSAGIGESSSKRSSIGDTSNKGVSINDSMRSEGRPLMLPDEIKKMEKGLMILNRSGSKPLLVEQPNYLSESVFRGRYDYNQYHLPSAIEESVRENAESIRAREMDDINRRFRAYDVKSNEIWATSVMEARKHFPDMAKDQKIGGARLESDIIVGGEIVLPGKDDPEASLSALRDRAIH